MKQISIIAVVIALVAFVLPSSICGAAQPSHKYQDMKGASSVERKSPAPQVKAKKTQDETSMDEHFKMLAEEDFDWHKYQSEFGVFGGDYLGDEWYNNWDVGARYYFDINKTFGFGVEYQYNPIRYDSSGDFGRSMTTQKSHTLFGALTVTNAAAFKSGKTILNCDLFLTLGGGSMQINRLWEWLAVVGGGIKVYTPMRWMAVRFDVNSYMHPTPKPGGDAFNADVAINVGVSFFVQPYRKKAPEESPADAPKVPSD